MSLGNRLPLACVQTSEIKEGISYDTTETGLMSHSISAGRHTLAVRLLRAPLAVACVSIFLASSGASAATLKQPLRFFEGRTELSGTLKAVMHGTRRVLSIGHGTIGADGALRLVQQVRDEGEQPHERVWLIHQVAPGKFAGSMSEATGPVTIDQVGDRYRFRFSLKGGMSAEQWLVPSADGRSGLSMLTVRKFGMVVARSKATIRRLSQQAAN